uniref:Uncharacterized protein n=1 Tax=Anguilla anguilla TaxID=7936 RepID=A0A0E9RTZ9_ANGAN
MATSVEIHLIYRLNIMDHNCKPRFS